MLSKHGTHRKKANKSWCKIKQAVSCCANDFVTFPRIISLKSNGIGFFYSPDFIFSPPLSLVLISFRFILIFALTFYGCLWRNWGKMKSASLHRTSSTEIYQLIVANAIRNDKLYRMKIVIEFQRSGMAIRQCSIANATAISY